MHNLSEDTYNRLPWPDSNMRPPFRDLAALQALPMPKRDCGWGKYYEYQTMVDAVVRHQPDKVLECGAGSGMLSAVLAGRGLDVRACDISPQFTELEGVICDEANLDDGLPYDDNSYDVVVSMQTIEHLENPYQFMREVKRVMKDGGIAVISTPNILSLPSRLQFSVLGDFRGYPPAMRREHLSIIPYWLMEEMCRRAELKITNVMTNVYYKPERLSKEWLAWPLTSTLGRLMAARKYPPETLHGYSLVVECAADSCAETPANQ